MKLLLDTHAFLWWLNDDERLGSGARQASESGENLVYVSAATTWEIALKRAAGRLEAPGDVAEWIEQSAFSDLPIEVAHAVASAELPQHHKDPFDRLLVAQARAEGLTLVAHEADIARYDVEIVDARG